MSRTGREERELPVYMISSLRSHPRSGLFPSRTVFVPALFLGRDLRDSLALPLAEQSPPHTFKHILRDDMRHRIRLLRLLPAEHARPDEDRPPAVVVRAGDIARGVVADHVDLAGNGADAVRGGVQVDRRAGLGVLDLGGEEGRGVVVRGLGRLPSGFSTVRVRWSAENRCGGPETSRDAPLQLVPRRELVHRHHTLLQRALPKPRHAKLVAPQQVRVREVNRQLVLGPPLRGVFWVFDGAEDARVGADEVEDELQVAAPVAGRGEEGFLRSVQSPSRGAGKTVCAPRVVKDEDGAERDGRKVGVLDVGPLLFRQFVVRPDGGLPRNDVGGDIGVLEAVAARRGRG